MAKVFSDYEAPTPAPHEQLAVSFESDEGKILLRPNKRGQGYKLLVDVENLGAGEVENEVVPRPGQRGALLGQQRETELDMYLPVKITSTSSVEVRRLASELAKVLKLADGTARISVMDPATGQTRYRDFAYQSGLSTPEWSSPLTAVYGLTVQYMDPWAYSDDEDSVTLTVAPGASGGLTVPIEFPVAFARSGTTRDRHATNIGNKPAPVSLRFDGPMTDPEVAIPGLWTFKLSGTLEWDEYIIVDSKQRTINIYRTTGAGVRSAYTWIKKRSRFTDLIIPPGRHSMTFRAIDDTYTASMTASWPHTYQSMI